MKKMIFTLALSLLVAVGANAQDAISTTDECCTQDEKSTKGDWYIGTGDIANVAWTQLSVTPSLGYGVTDKLMVGLSVIQADSTADLAIGLLGRYFMNVAGQDFFLYASASDLDIDNLSLGFGKMFTVHKSVFIEPKFVYHIGEKTTNMMLGFGLRF
jgi:hypothetical protein|tara:strand:+ start:479 stop:949 length:471 start_codon:yes stop_codon:yes gene_type:complete